MKLNKFKLEKLSTNLLQNVTGGKQNFETAYTSYRFTSTTAKIITLIHTTLIN